MSVNIDEAIEEAWAWLEIDGVELVGQGKHEGEDCIVVGVSKPADELRDLLPRSLHGFAVVLEFTDEIRAS